MSGTTDDDPILSERVWERGWEEHELRQLRRLAKLTLAQKLAWLEEAHRLVMHLQSQRDAQRGGETGQEGG